MSNNLWELLADGQWLVAGFAALLSAEQLAAWRAERVASSARLAAAAAVTAGVFVTNAGVLSALDHGTDANGWLFARSIALSLLMLSAVMLLGGILRGRAPRSLLIVLGSLVLLRTVLWPTTDLLFGHVVVGGVPAYGPLEGPLGVIALALVFGYVWMAVLAEESYEQRLILSTGLMGSLILSGLSLTQGGGYRAEVLTGYVPLPSLVTIAFVVWHRQLDAVRLAGQLARRERALADLGRSAITARLEEVEARGTDLSKAEGATDFTLAVAAIVEAARTRATLESELRRAQKLEVAGRLAAGIAHDFNNVLLAQRGLGQIALRELRAARVPSASQHVASMLEVVDRAVGLTRQLLAFARRQAIEPDVLDLNTIVSELGGWLRHLIGSHVRLRVHVNADPVHVEADRGQLEQVLVNLALNARDAMSDGGTIDITVRNPAEGTARVDVRDNGAGMSEELAAQIFDPFFSTKGDSGTGLGLAIVHGIVTQARGTISVASTPGDGTTFSIALPTVDAPERHTPDIQDDASTTVGARGILVVEDIDVVRAVVVDMLEVHGYDVLSAESLGAARTIAREHTGQLDVLITDVMLVDATGFEIAQSVRALRPDIAVLYMSGHPPDAIDPAHFIQKPFDDADLAAAVERVAALGQPADL